MAETTTSQDQFLVAHKLFVERMKETNSDNVDELERRLSKAQEDLKKGELADVYETKDHVQDLEKQLQRAKATHLAMVTDTAHQCCEEAETFMRVFELVKMQDQ